MALVVGFWRKLHAGYLFRNRLSGRSFLSLLLAICRWRFTLP